MPIKGLTTQAPQFPIMGKLRKGAEKPTNSKRPGMDQDHFRYTSDTHPESVKAFNKLFKQPQSLTVLLPYSTVDENFEAWQEVWGSGRLKHRCDGEMIHMVYDDQKRAYVYPKNMPCPGGCKQVGRLKVIIPTMLQAGHVGVVMLETHSKWDISGIYGALAHYYDMRKNLQGIEFILHRYPREVSTPGHGRQSKWLVGIKPNHEWVLAQLGAQMEYQALPQSSVPLLDIPEVMSPDEYHLKDDYEQHIQYIEDGEFTEDQPEPEPVKTGQFHAAGMALCNNSKTLWKEYRKTVVKGLTDGDYESSSDLTQEQVDKGTRGMATKKRLIDELWKLDDLYMGDLNAVLEEKDVFPLYELSVKEIKALTEELKGAEPTQPPLVEANGKGKGAYSAKV